MKKSTLKQVEQMVDSLNVVLRYQPYWEMVMDAECSHVDFCEDLTKKEAIILIQKTAKPSISLKGGFQNYSVIDGEVEVVGSELRPITDTALVRVMYMGRAGRHDFWDANCYVQLVKP